ncbi:SH3 domain-containing protein [Calditrichota bacterium GD2]
MIRQFAFFSLFLTFLYSLSACMPSAVKKVEEPAEHRDISRPAIGIKAYVVKESVSLRQGPAFTASIKTTLQDGEALRILENRNGWYHVITESGLKGWVRSNLVGPRNLSKTLMATAFNDSIMPRFSAQLFIDKNKPYRVIYLQFADGKTSKPYSIIKRIARAYQKKVYHGTVTVHLIKPNSRKPVKTYTFKGLEIGDIPLPVLPVGILHGLKLNETAVKLYIFAPDNISRNKLLNMARKASATYEYPFEKTEIIVRSLGNKKCRLYYIEDAYGEDYAFGRCGPPSS